MWFVASPVRTLFPHGAAATLLAVVVATGVIHDLRLIRGQASRGRQVPGSWRSRYGHYKAFAAFGGLLGGGIFTFVPFMLTYVVFAAAALLLALGPAVLCGIAFGVIRTSAVAVGSAAAPTAARFLQWIQHMRWLPQGVSALLSVALLALGVAATYS